MAILLQIRHVWKHIVCYILHYRTKKHASPAGSWCRNPQIPNLSPCLNRLLVVPSGLLCGLAMLVQHTVVSVKEPVEAVIASNGYPVEREAFPVVTLCVQQALGGSLKRVNRYRFLYMIVLKPILSGAK